MEIKINAAQHTYGNVEADASPSKKRGFQTLFYTLNKINDEELAEIEKRMIYYFDEENPVKQLFFSLKDKVVVSRIIPRPETDKFGRRGIYFAHSLIFDKKEFVKINANPFILFRKFKFMESPDEVMSKGDFKTGNIGETELEISGEELEYIEKLMIEEMKKWINESKNIIHIACNPKLLAEKKIFLKVEAEQKEMENFLMAIFSIIPSEYRLDLSFDTYFYSCDPVMNYFNIIGILPKQSFLFRNYIQANIDKKTIEYNNEDDVKQDDSIYSKWINQSVGRLDWNSILKNREAVCAFENFINDKEYNKELLIKILYYSDTDEFISNLVNFKIEIWKDKVRNEIEKHFGKTIAYRTAPAVVNKGIHKNLLNWMLTNFDETEIANTLYEELLNNLDEISQSEISEIEKFLKLSSPLLVIISFIKNDNKFKENLNAVTVNTVNEYKKFAHAVLLKKPMRMFELLLPDKRNLFVETLIELSEGSREIDKNIRSVIKPEVKSKIEKEFDGKIAEVCADRISKEYKIDEHLINSTLDGFDKNEIEEIMYDVILKDIGKNESPALKDIEPFFDKLHHEGLLAAACFIKKDKKFHEHFDKLNSENYKEDYKKFLRAVIMNKPTRIKELMLPETERFMSAFPELLKELGEKEDIDNINKGFCKVITTLINKKEWEILDILEPYIEKFHFSYEELKNIKDLIKNKRNTSASAGKFVEKLDELLSESKQREAGSFLSKFKNELKRKIS